MKTDKEQKSIYETCRNDRVDGLKGRVEFVDGKKKCTFQYDGKYKMGYDGCGAHTHDW